MRRNGRDAPRADLQGSRAATISPRTFSPELADLTIYGIDVSGGEKIPRKCGPGITRSDLLVINKTDLALTRRSLRSSSSTTDGSARLVQPT